MADPKLKVVVGADTSGFSKGMKESKQSLKDFGQVSDGVLGKVGDAFGVNVGQVEKLQSAFKGLGQKMSQSANEGTAAFGKLITSMSGATAAVAGLGLAGAVASFKLLNEEAAAFKNTVAGANLEMQTAAYLSTYKQVLHDLNGATGENVANMEESLKRGFGSFFAGLKNFVLNGITSSSGLMDPLNIIKATMGSKAAGEAGGQAAEIAQQIYEIQLKQIQNQVTIANLDAQIAEQRRIAYDNTYSAAEQLSAITNMQGLMQQKLDLTLPLEQQLADLYERRNNLASSSLADVKQLAEQQAKVQKTQADANNEMASLLRKQNTLTAKVQEEAEAAERVKNSRAELAELLSNTSKLSLPALASTSLGGGITVPVRAEVDMNSVEISVQQLNSLISEGVTSLSSTIGELIGDLVTGGDAWGNFANAAMSAFGDLAISIGKIAIEAGLASEGIKDALALGNPYVAIAAGAALVALGAAVKAGLSNVANGGGGYSAPAVASGGYTGTGGASSMDWYEKTGITINVTGTLKGEGSQLIAVINQEEERKKHTV